MLFRSKEHDDTFTETEHFAALAERQDREIQVLKADLARVEGERDKLGVELSGAVERSTLILAAKNDWLDRAVAAEASLTRLRLQYDAVVDRIEKLKAQSAREYATQLDRYDGMRAIYCDGEVHAYQHVIELLTAARALQGGTEG